MKLPGLLSMGPHACNSQARCHMLLLQALSTLDPIASVIRAISTTIFHWNQLYNRLPDFKPHMGTVLSESISVIRSKCLRSTLATA